MASSLAHSAVRRHYADIETATADASSKDETRRALAADLRPNVDPMGVATGSTKHGRDMDRHQMEGYMDRQTVLSFSSSNLHRLRARLRRLPCLRGACIPIDALPHSVTDCCAIPKFASRSQRGLVHKRALALHPHSL